MDDEEPVPDLRNTMLGVGITGVLIAVPLGVRALFGVFHSLHLVLGLLFTLFLLTITMTAMTAVFRRVLRAGRTHLAALGHAVATGALVSTALCLLWLPAMYRFPEAFHLMPGEPNTVAYFLATSLSDSLFVSVIWAAVFLYPTAQRSVRVRERALEAARREAELLRLRAHLEPHFVLNTLNAIAGMVVDEPRSARALLGSLGDLFRDAASDSERRTVREEVSWLERYASIIEARYGDALRFEWSIDDRALDAAIPALLLQPIIENAVNHGALRRPGGGTVQVRILREGPVLRCEVQDDGPGPSTSPRRPGARGLAIVERRLALEAPGSECVLRAAEPQGTLAVLRVVQREGGAR